MVKETLPPQEPLQVPMSVDHHLDHFDHRLHPQYFKRISWTAILVGALVAIGLGFLFNLFGLAIGLSAFTVSKTGAFALTIGGVIGIGIGTIAAMVVAGYAAGYLGRLYCPKRNLGIVYGFTTWTVALLLSAVVTADIGHYTTWYGRVLLGSAAMSQNMKANNAPITVQTTSSIPSNSMVTNQPVPVQNQMAPTQTVTNMTFTPENLACIAFMIFGLFFLGAFSACVGACWAMECRRDD